MTAAPSRDALIRAAAAQLAEAGVAEPERDARLLYRWAARLDGAGLAAGIGEPAEMAEQARFALAVEARAQRMPVSHITGRREFWGRSFEVSEHVLDPRPETETLVAAALAGPAPARILDLGTGSGCILATLLCEWPNAHGTGVDISLEALGVAARNAERLGLAGRIELLRTDWLQGIEGPFDLVVSNPPYIAFAELGDLAPEVKEFEPIVALTPGGDGLGAYRQIAAGVGRVLAPGGRVMVEVGEGQAEAVSALFAAAGLEPAGTRPDMDGRTRVVLVRLPGNIPGARH